MHEEPKITDNLFVYKHKSTNIVFAIIENDDIFKAEKILSLIYHSKLKDIQNKRYVLVNKYQYLTEIFYRNKLSVVLKVRAMENYCAVLLESNSINCCYQTGMCRNAQVIKATRNTYRIDLSRTTGPESIWKNKGRDFKSNWRSGFETLIQECTRLSEITK